MSELEIEVKHLAEALLKKKAYIGYSGAVCAAFLMLMAKKVGRVDVEPKDIADVAISGGAPAEVAHEVAKILGRAGDGWRRYMTAFSSEALEAFIIDPTPVSYTRERKRRSVRCSDADLGVDACSWFAWHYQG